MLGIMLCGMHHFQGSSARLILTKADSGLQSVRLVILGTAGDCLAALLHVQHASREVQASGLVRRVLLLAACCLACQGCARVEWLCVYVSFAWYCMVMVSH
jgi:hypothetical protein